MKTAFFLFYEELNDFLPAAKKKRRFEHSFTGSPSVKDMIESIGVPHVEIDLILISGKSIGFNYHVKNKDDISVFPVFETFDISDIQHLRAKPLPEPKFVLDVHLGKLAKYMRMLGFDTLYETNYTDEQIVEIASKEKRTILTKDLGILKRNGVTHGYWVRSKNSEEQVKEIIERFDLRNEIKELTRCLECNGLLQKVEKEKVLNRLPEKVKQYQEEFFRCSNCDKIYWKGSHHSEMLKLIPKLT
jgi:uncharacterized protein with PIN domain